MIVFVEGQSTENIFVLVDRLAIVTSLLLEIVVAIWVAERSLLGWGVDIATVLDMSAPKV
jgi:hypothetical protein